MWKISAVLGVFSIRIDASNPYICLRLLSSFNTRKYTYVIASQRAHTSGYIGR
jgi:hypothetical protein